MLAARRLRTKGRNLANAILGIVAELEPPLTVRQIYYQCVARALIENSYRSYKRAADLVLQLRRGGELSWRSVVDRTRRVDVPATWSDLSDFMESVRGAYRRDLWAGQPTHVIFAVEKDAMAGFVSSVTYGYRVPLYVIRGFCSESYLFEVASELKETGKPITLYYLGDHDPSGRDIERAFVEGLREHGAELEAHRLAIEAGDIERFQLPPATAKKTDTRLKKFVAKYGSDTVELDALPPAEIRRRVKKAIESHLDVAEWNRLVDIETLENETLAGVIQKMGLDPTSAPAGHQQSSEG